MNFFLSESSDALEAFIRKFIDDTEAAPSFLKHIKEYAGCDETGEVLNNILLKLEDEFGPVTPITDEPQHVVVAGVVNENCVRVWFHPENYNMIHNSNVCARMTTWEGDWNDETHGLDRDSAIMCKIDNDAWSFKTRRDALIMMILIQFQDVRCTYCDRLIVAHARCCEACSRVVRKNGGCRLCKRKAGRLNEDGVHESCERGKNV